MTDSKSSATPSSLSSSSDALCIKCSPVPIYRKERHFLRTFTFTSIVSTSITSTASTSTTGTASTTSTRFQMFNLQNWARKTGRRHCPAVESINTPEERLQGVFILVSVLVQIIQSVAGETPA